LKISLKILRNSDKQLNFSTISIEKKADLLRLERYEIFYEFFPMPHSKFIVLEWFDLKITISRCGLLWHESNFIF